jgi:ATP-binding cassette subfamily B protein
MHLAMRGAYLLGVIICATNISKDAMSYGTMMAVLQLINQVEAPFSNISSYLPQYYAMIASAERLIEIENMEKDFDGEMHSKDKIKEYYENNFSAVGLHNVYFSYVEQGNGKTHVLNKKSIEIQKGEYVAFVGKSGCGKSTAMKLMMSLYSLDKGEKYLLNKDGSKNDLTAEWRGLFSYVPQGNYLVSGTIREVLTFGNAELLENDDAIHSALKIACADEFVKDLPGGLDTLLGEQGSGLSEGQIQRLAIARAIISERPILMLDEATSSLDGITEEQLLMNLRTMTDKTVILITHRPAALSICDRKIKI